MTQHTPGPWKYDWIEKSIFYDDNDVQPRIAIMDGDNTSEDQNAADARLIAAAPDLLAALKAIVGCLGPEGYLSACGKSITDQARAAIAKAEGK